MMGAQMDDVCLHERVVDQRLHQPVICLLVVLSLPLFTLLTQEELADG